MVKKRCCSQWEPTTPFEALPAGFLPTYFNGCCRPSLHQFPERAALPCQSLTSAKATCYHNRTNSSQAPHVVVWWAQMCDHRHYMHWILLQARGLCTCQSQRKRKPNCFRFSRTTHPLESNGCNSERMSSKVPSCSLATDQCTKLYSPTLNKIVM